jgi:hypothetical protein
VKIEARDPSFPLCPDYLKNHPDAMNRVAHLQGGKARRPAPLTASSPKRSINA